MNPRTKAGALVFAAFAIVWAFSNRGSFNPSAFQYDFVAFYCASSVALDGADPYRTEPLRACEHRAGHAFRPDSKLAVPAPVPGYGLALIAPIAKLPFPIAAILWTALLIAAYIVSVVALVRLSGLSPPLVAAATALSIGYLSLVLGQLVPIAIAALCLAALAVERERWRTAAACCAVAAIEPHLALPAIVALFAMRAASRVPLAVALGVLGAASLAMLGIARNIEYLTRVVHAQVASEITRADQLSLAALGYRFGMSVDAAAAWGTFTYFVALAAGVWLGILAARRMNSPAALVLIPPAIALLGAPYVHTHHLAAAIPAALLLAGRSQVKLPAAIAAFLLCVPWITPYDATPLLPLDALAIALLAHGLLKLSPLRSAALGALATIALFAAHAALVPLVPPPPSAYAAIGPNDLAEAGWRILVDATFHDNRVLFTLLALPAWGAMVALVVACTRAARPVTAPA